MSGIAGIWSLSGSDEHAHLGALASELRCRGPDRTGVWHGDGIALAHCLLATTKEAEREMQPLTDDETGCTIVADVRLDNRDDLLAELAGGADAENVGDAELILRAYLKWGEACPVHLLGDFAFAIFDSRSSALFCARDHLGMRQLIYHHRPGEMFAFATEADALTKLPFVPAILNEERVADFLAHLEGSSFTSTMYAGISRLPPATSMTVNQSGIHYERFWEARPQPMLELPSDEACAAAFLDVFTQAVRSRLRRNGQVGAMLSGGTDSNAAVAVASRLLEQEGEHLRTFSAVGPDSANCIETRLIHESVDHGQYDATLIDFSRLDDAERLRQLGEESLEPFDGVSALTRAVYHAAHRRGIRIVIDGAAADVMLSPGNLAASLIAKGKFREAWREAGAEAGFWNEPKTRVSKFVKAAWTALVPLPLRRLRRTLGGLLHDRSSNGAVAVLDKAFARRSRLHVRRKQFWRGLESKRAFGPDYLARIINHPNLVVGRERYDRVASQSAIEPRDPFMDLRVVNFCLSLPPEQFHANGFPKIILRRAIDGLVPSTVAWRVNKTHIGQHFLDAIHRASDEIDRDEIPPELAGFVAGPRQDSDLPPNWYRYEWRALRDWLRARNFTR